MFTGCTEKGDYTEGKKGGAPNLSIPRHSDDCAEQRQGGERNKIARLGIHFALPNLKGAATGLPLPCSRGDGLEPQLTTDVSDHLRRELWSDPIHESRKGYSAEALSPWLTVITCGDIAADLISALFTGSHSKIAATDQIRPIATTTAIPIPVRICIPLRVALAISG